MRAYVLPILRIARTEPDGVLEEGNSLLYRPYKDLAQAYMEQCTIRIAIEGEHCLEFGNGFSASPLRPQDLCFDVMGECSSKS